MSAPNRRPWIVPLLAMAHGLAWASIAAAVFKPIGGWHLQDLQLYFRTSEDLMRGMMPYRDFPLEYPPLALLPIALPALISGDRSVDLPRYTWLFLVCNAVWSSLLAFYVMRLSRRWMSWGGTLVTFTLFTAFSAIGAPLFPWRFDLFPALLTAVAVIAVLDNRPGLGGALTGLGIATKLYPAVLLPVFGAWYLAAGDRRSLIHVVVGAIAVPIAVVLPFLILAPNDVIAFAEYHQKRGLQLESVASGLLMIGRSVGAVDLAAASNYGAIHLRSPIDYAVNGALAVAFVGSMALITFCALRQFRLDRERNGSSLVGFVLAALLAFIVTNKVFSPQYLVWLLPFVPFLRRKQAVVAMAAFALSIFLFPYNYESLVRMEGIAVLALNARNLLLVGLAIWLVLPRRRSAQTRSGTLTQPLRIGEHSRARDGHLASR